MIHRNNYICKTIDDTVMTLMILILEIEREIQLCKRLQNMDASITIAATITATHTQQ